MINIHKTPTNSNKMSILVLSQGLAEHLRAISKNGVLTYEKIDKAILGGIKNKPKNFKVSLKKVDSYFSVDTTPREFEDTIIKALDYWFEAHPKNNGEIAKGKVR